MPTNGISGSIAHCSCCHRRVARFPQLGQHFDLQVWKRLLNGAPLRGHYKEFGAISGSRSNSPLRRMGWSSTLFRHVVCLSCAARTTDMEVLQRPHMRRVYRVSCASVRFPLAPDRRQPICRIFGLCQSLQLAFVFPLVSAALSSAHGQPWTQTARDANGSRARLPLLRRSHFFSPLQLSLRAPFLRPLRRRESTNQCARRADP
jgi:hypothetical protein